MVLLVEVALVFKNLLEVLDVLHGSDHLLHNEWGEGEILISANSTGLSYTHTNVAAWYLVC